MSDSASISANGSALGAPEENVRAEGGRDVDQAGAPSRDEAATDENINDSNSPNADPPGIERWLAWIARPALCVYLPAMAIVTHMPETETLARVSWELRDVQPDKLVHFGSYIMLALLMVFASLAGRNKSFVTNLCVGCAAATAYAFIDELTQPLPWFGRTASGADLTADLWAIVSVFLALLLGRVADLRVSKRVLAARLALVVMVPLTGVALFSPRINLEFWRVFPAWFPYVRGDYLGHFAAGLFLTWIIVLASPCGVRRRWWNWTVAIAAQAVTAPILEWVQGAYFARDGEMADMIAHAWGIVAAIALWLLWLGAKKWVKEVRGVVYESPTPGTRTYAAVAKGDAAVAQEGADLQHGGELAPAPLPLREGLGEGRASAVPDDTETEPIAGQQQGDSESSTAHAHVSTHEHGTRAQQSHEQNSTGETPVPPQTPAARATDDAKSGRFVGHALLVAGLTLVSRVTGLLRDAVLAAVFGLTAIADAFAIGFLIPNLFRRLFGEGALTASFIPAYSELLRTDRLTARRLASLCVALLLVVTAGITLIGEAVLAAMNAAELSRDTHLAIELTMIMLPYMPMICLTAFLGGILQVHGRFGPPAAAPIMLNVIMIAFALFATNGVLNLGGQSALGVDYEPIRRVVPIIAIGVLVAGFAQLLWHALIVIRFETLTTTFTGAKEPLKRMVIMMLPMLIGLAVFQINTLTDALIAFTLSPKAGGPEHLTLFGFEVAHPIRDNGAVAALQWSQRLYQFPLGVFGIAIATAIFPALAHAAADTSETGRRGVRTILQHGLRLTFFIGLPASVGLILVRVPLSRVIYEHGAFGKSDSLRVATILIGYASAVWAYSMTHVVTRAFYAMKDARTPLKISMLMVALNLVLNLTLIWPLGVAGLAWSSAICAAGQVTLLLLAVRRYVDQPIDASVLRSWRMTGFLTAVMTAALLPIVLLWPAADLSRGGAAGQLAMMVLIGGVLFAAGAWALRCEELRWLVRRRTTER